MHVARLIHVTLVAMQVAAIDNITGYTLEKKACFAASVSVDHLSGFGKAIAVAAAADGSQV